MTKTPYKTPQTSIKVAKNAWGHVTTCDTWSQVTGASLSKKRSKFDVSVFWRCDIQMAEKSKVWYTVDQDTSASNTDHNFVIPTTKLTRGDHHVTTLWPSDGPPLPVTASAFDPPPERGGRGKSTRKHLQALANTRKHSRALASPRECLRVLLTLPLRGAAGAAGHLESWVTCWNMRSNLCFIAAILISSRLPVMVFFGGLVTCVPTLCPNPLSSSSAIFWKFEVAKNGKTYYTKPLGIF